MEKTKQNKSHDFTQGNVAGQLLRFASPLFLSSLLQVVYNMADMIIVSHVSGKTGLSGVSVGGDVSNFLTFLVMGFANAGSVIISQYIGAGQKHKVGRFMGTLFSTLGIFAVSLSVVCLFLRRQLLVWMHCPEESFPEALGYATVCIAGLVFICGYNAVSAVFRGMGDSKRPFVFISVAAVMNIALDLLFVMGFHMGATGAGLATVISQGFSFIISTVYLFKNIRDYGITFGRQDITIDREMCATLFKLGIPMAIKGASIMFSKLFVNSWVNSYGISVSAMAGIANKFGSVSNLFSNAINTSGSAMVGQNIGAEKYRRVPHIMLISFAVTFGIAVVLSAVLLLWPEFIFGIFTKDPSVMKVAMEFLPIAVLLFFGSSFRACMNSLLNGSGNYPLNFVTALFDGMINRIGFGLLFGLALNMGYVGFWLGDAVAGFTPFVIGLIYFCSGKWKTRKYIIHE